jgi:hypothetical protein
MKNFRFPAFFFALTVILSSVPAQAQVVNDNFYNVFNVAAALKDGRGARNQTVSPDRQIKNIQSFHEKSGVAYTSDIVFRTDSDGKHWREITLPKKANEKISAVYFENDNIGSAILADSARAVLILAKTVDGGDSWTRTPIELRTEDLGIADLENARLEARGNSVFILSVSLTTSSNFDGKVVYESFDAGQSWQFIEQKVELRRDDAATENVSGGWTLRNIGTCENKKTGCVQETKVYSGDREITPPPIKQLAELEKFNARLEAQNSIFAQAPGGATRISLNRGFDKCTAATVSQMRTWWDNSPYYDANIYLSGRNRGCSQPQLTAAWVEQVSAMGWGLIPTVVGYQAPCSVSTNSAKHSSDPATAETQGRGEADIAIADAGNLGLTQGTVLYYDMERYDEVAATPGCRASVKAFLKGWTDRLKERGYISGVYGSPTNAVADWTTIPAESRMDAVWLARWDNVPSVWFYASPSPAIPDGFWMNHQRIKQWQAPHNETWGGVTFNIDGDISDAPVAGAAIAKNKPADILNSANQNISGIGFGGGSDVLAPGDFDGDGKTDTAVFRSSEGNWYMLTKANAFTSRQFGSSGDVPVPADYNGDGKTDIAVFRPSNGVWYIANSDSRGTFTFVQFGALGDKPVIGDYDGDGKADLAVWRPSNGVWYVLRSSDGNLFAAAFGVSTDQPAQGDFDGDGRTDLAVYRGGVWYLLQTTTGFSAISFGQSGDLPVTGDYDGDNKADVSVYRPSNGVWYMLQSRAGFSAAQFGNSTDKPIPSAYLPQ